MPAIVEIESLSKSFPNTQSPAISNLTCSLEAGKIIALAGPDGSGKTTLMRLIAGLLLPTSGSIRVAGLDTVKQAEEIHTIIGYMPQKFGLYEDITVEHNLNLYFDLKQIPYNEKEELYKKLLHFTGLDRFRTRYAGALSGGMKQKLGLACALMNTPKLLILDEPTIGVDPLSRLELWAIVSDMLAEGVTVLWSTSYLDEAERCDSVLLLNDGNLIYQGPPQDLLSQREGRVFRISGAGDRIQSLTKKSLMHPDVTDAIILGSEIRLFTHSKGTIEQIVNYLSPDGTLTYRPDKPRLEDAYIDLLGAKVKGESVLAQHMPVVPEDRQEMIVADQLVKKFGSFTAVNGVSFTINRGEIFGLLGPNGAGKSTTFKMLCGLLTPTSGRTKVCGYDLSHAPADGRAQIGYMAQKFSLYDNLSAMENLLFFSGIYGLSGSAQKKKIDQMIGIFGLERHLNESASQLPLGFKQRLALSCSLMHNPKILFLDEPTSGVDPLTRREFWSHINALVEKGTTIMVTTHFMDEAEFCDRLALIYRGNTISLGTTKDLKTKAASPQNPNPTLEEAFIQLIEQYDKNNG